MKNKINIRIKSIMARKKKEEEIVESNESSSDKFKKFIKGLRKEIDSDSFESSKYGEISEYIDTGDYGLNRIITGSPLRGIPAGRIVTIVGESATGKSFMAAQIASNALNKLHYHNIFYFDSEGGGLRKFFEARGCDPAKIEHVLLDSVEDATVKILQTFTAVQEFKKEMPEYKTLFILDSLGGLVTNKFINDATSGKVVSDMGLRAKLVNNLIKGCTIPALKTNVAFLVINHTYADPASMFASKIQNQGGGGGIKYMSRLTIQCGRCLEKSSAQKEKIKAKPKKSKVIKEVEVEEETTEIKDESFYDAAIMNFFTVKNNIIKPFQTSEMFLKFSSGPVKYYGLKEVAMKYKLLLNGEKQGYYRFHDETPEEDRKLSVILNDDKKWQSILPALEEMSIQELSYGDGQELEMDEIEEESVENIIETTTLSESTSDSTNVNQ